MHVGPVRIRILRSRRLYCAELCAVSACAIDRKPVTCPVTTIPFNLFLVNCHRVISNRPAVDLPTR